VISDPDPIKLLNLLEKHMKSECFRVTWG